MISLIYHTKLNNPNVHLVQYGLRSVNAVWKESEDWRKGFVKEMSFKSGVRGTKSCPDRPIVGLAYGHSVRGVDPGGPGGGRPPIFC